MTLPYANATAGDKALAEIQKFLKQMGCKKFGHMIDEDEQTITVQFVYRSRQVSVRASMKGYAAALLKANPHTSRKQSGKSEWEQKALEQASISVFSILRDWIKGQVTAVETGVLSFEGAFLGQIILPNGKTVHEAIDQQKLLPNQEGHNDG